MTVWTNVGPITERLLRRVGGRGHRPFPADEIISALPGESVRLDNKLTMEWAIHLYDSFLNNVKNDQEFAHAYTCTLMIFVSLSLCSPFLNSVASLLSITVS